MGIGVKTRVGVWQQQPRKISEGGMVGLGSKGTSSVLLPLLAAPSVHAVLFGSLGKPAKPYSMHWWGCQQ